MGLTVTTARPPRITSVGDNNGGMQPTSSNYPLQSGNVQSTVQPAATQSQIQSRPTASRIQNAPATAAMVAAAAAQVAKAAEVAAAAARAEVARQKEVRRQQFQLKVDTTVSQKRTEIIKRTTVAQQTGRIGKTSVRRTGRITMPKLSPYDQARVDAYWEAMADIDGRRHADKKGIGKLWDKVTFGQDQRDAQARKYAADALSRYGSDHVDGYTKDVNSFITEQAGRRANIESTKFKSQTEFDKAVQDYEKWETEQIDRLEHGRARLEGASGAYEKGATASLTSTAAKLAAKANTLTKPVQGALGQVWKYTLGSGSEAVPSLTTAPSRVVNFFGNINTSDRQIQKTGGGTVNRLETGKNAWQSTFGQRNINLRPKVDLDPNSPEARKLFDDKALSLIAARKRAGRTEPTELDLDRVRAQLVASHNRTQKNQNSLLEFAADPLIAGGPLSRSGKLESLSSRSASALGNTPVGRRFVSLVNSITSTKPAKWLGAEHKSISEQLGEAIQVAKSAKGAGQKKFFASINALNKELAGPGKKLDTSIFDDLATLTDHETAILRRVKIGSDFTIKFTPRDRLRLVGRSGAIVRARLEDIAQRWTKFGEDLKLPDGVKRTSFGRGGKFYIPQTKWARGRLDEYNFLARQSKRRGSVSADDFRQGAIDRYFKSNIDDVYAGEQNLLRSEKRAKRDRLVKDYEAEIEPHHQKIDALYDKLPWYMKKDKANVPARVARFAASNTPVKLWKKSVLKYRPAWYVNNALYNTPASVLAGGLRALPEQARLLRPKNLRAAKAELPEGVASKISNEVGQAGPLSRFAANVENVPRIAAFRALKAKGYTDDEALKFVDRYLLNYKVKNWERPIRAVVPFWSFQKGVAKAAAHMPLDRPIAAKGYNLLDQYQQQQFDKDFATMVPKLHEMGFSDEEIEQMRSQQAQMFKGRLKVGGHYITTPFNAFSERGLSSAGINPYIAAAGEVATSTDSFGRTVKGDESTLISRLVSKFPQLQLAKKAKAKFWDNPKYKPTKKWIGAPGSGGYGMPKEAQGYDPSKPNYQTALDKSNRLGNDITAFFGKPSDIEFNKPTFLRRKLLERVKGEYFSRDWKAEFPDFDARQKAQNALFDRYGVTADDFFDKELSKYDTEDTTRIKRLKEDARTKNSALFEEYGRQPVGTRKVWAAQKLKQLVDSGYFDDNPFLESFDWLKPEQIQSAQKTIAYREAKRTSNWAAYNTAYGVNQKAQRKLHYDLAKLTGNWDLYTRKYGLSEKAKTAKFWQKYYAAPAGETRRRLLLDNPQYAKKSPGSSAAHPENDRPAAREAKFWQQYSAATPEARRKLLADNPQYNRRANWTPAQWDAEKNNSRLLLRAKARQLDGFKDREATKLMTNQALARRVLNKPRRTKNGKLLLSA